MVPRNRSFQKAGASEVLVVTSSRWVLMHESRDEPEPTIEALIELRRERLGDEVGSRAAARARAMLEHHRGAREDTDEGRLALVEGIAGAARQVFRTGSPAQIEAAATILADTRRALYLLLADGPEAATKDEPSDG